MKKTELLLGRSGKLDVSLMMLKTGYDGKRREKRKAASSMLEILFL